MTKETKSIVETTSSGGCAGDGSDTGRVVQGGLNKAAETKRDIKNLSSGGCAGDGSDTGRVVQK